MLCAEVESFSRKEPLRMRVDQCHTITRKQPQQVKKTEIFLIDEWDTDTHRGPNMAVEQGYAWKFDFLIFWINPAHPTFKVERKKLPARSVNLMSSGNPTWCEFYISTTLAWNRDPIQLYLFPEVQSNWSGQTEEQAYVGTVKHTNN